MPPLPTVRRSVQLHQAQLAYRRSNVPYRGFVGGRGSGKSWVGAYDVIRRARRGRLYLVASPTYTILQDTTLRSFLEIGRGLGVIGPGAVHRSPPPSVRLSTGAEVIFRSADDPERLRGPNLSGCWLDEASLMHRDAYDIAIACLRQGGEQGWLGATFTPAGLTHWTYDRFGRRRPDGGAAYPDTELFHARTRDNPFAPPGFHDTVAGQYSGLRAAQELDGRFVSLEGAEWPPEYFPDALWFSDFPQGVTASALALDPAQGKGEKGKGCYAAFVLACLDRAGTVWADAWLSQTWDAPQLVAKAFELHGLHRPQAVSVEVNGGQHFLLPLLFQHGRAVQKVLPLYAVNNSADKEVRVRELGPLLAQGRLRFRDTPGGRLLVQQLRDFPVGEYMDGPDALEMAVRMARWLLGQRGGPGQPEVQRG